MKGLLKWDGNVLQIGKTQMAEVRTRCEGLEYDYVIGPKDFVSEPYERKEDAHQDCERHIRRLLKKAGVEDA
jgi:hypothetical protein